MEKWRLKLTSAKVEVEVEAELGNENTLLNMIEIVPMHGGCGFGKNCLNVSTHHYDE